MKSSSAVREASMPRGRRRVSGRPNLRAVRAARNAWEGPTSDVRRDERPDAARPGGGGYRPAERGIRSAENDRTAALVLGPTPGRRSSHARASATGRCGQKIERQLAASVGTRRRIPECVGLSARARYRRRWSPGVGGGRVADRSPSRGSARAERERRVPSRRSWCGARAARKPTPTSGPDCGSRRSGSRKGRTTAHGPARLWRERGVSRGRKRRHDLLIPMRKPRKSRKQRPFRLFNVASGALPGRAHQLLRLSALSAAQKTGADWQRSQCEQGDRTRLRRGGRADDNVAARRIAERYPHFRWG